MLAINTKKTSKKNTPFKILLILGGVGFLAVGGWFAFQQFFKATPPAASTETRPVNSIDYSPPSDEQKRAADAQKEEILKQDEGDKPSETASSLTVTISRAGQGGAAQPVEVRTLVAGTQAGECTFTFSKSGQADVVATATIIYEATAATCGVDVAAAKFGVDGSWNMKVVARQGDSKGLAEEVVEVKK